jgi:hypothetical protein
MKKRFSLTRVFKQRDKIFQAIKPYIDRPIFGDTVRDLVADVYRVLPNYVSHDAVFESSRGLASGALAGATLERKIAAEFAWRLAGNIDKLIAGQPVLPWTRQSADEWLPVLVTRVDDAYRRGKTGCIFHMRVLAGSPCPMLFTQFMSRASCAAISKRIGFSRNIPYVHGAYVTGLRFWAHIDAGKSNESLFFREVDCTPSMRAGNRKILEIRARLQPCPRNYQHECMNCAIGYDTCIAAIFARELTLQLCPRCNLNARFDLTRSEEICLMCWQRNSFKNPAGN